MPKKAKTLNSAIQLAKLPTLDMDDNDIEHFDLFHSSYKFQIQWYPTKKIEFYIVKIDDGLLMTINYNKDNSDIEYAENASLIGEWNETQQLMNNWWSTKKYSRWQSQNQTLFNNQLLNQEFFLPNINYSNVYNIPHPSSTLISSNQLLPTLNIENLPQSTPVTNIGYMNEELLKTTLLSGFDPNNVQINVPTMYLTAHTDCSIRISLNLISESMLDLIDEFTFCFQNEKYFACCCLARELILETALMYGLEIKNNGRIDFEANINKMRNHGLLSKNDVKFWKRYNKNAGDVIHYQRKDREKVADEAFKGFTKVFEYLNKKQKEA